MVKSTSDLSEFELTAVYVQATSCSSCSTMEPQYELLGCVGRERRACDSCEFEKSESDDAGIDTRRRMRRRLGISVAIMPTILTGDFHTP